MSGAVRLTSERDDDTLSAHQICLLKEQDEKKALYEKLPALLKLIAGDSKILAASEPELSLSLNPSDEELKRTIAANPEDPDPMRGWGTRKEGHAFTATGFIIRRSDLSLPSSNETVQLFEFSLGQPGRPYSMPMNAFRGDAKNLEAKVNGTYRFTPSTGLPEDRKPYLVRLKATMRLRLIDERHVLIQVDDKTSPGWSLNFTPHLSLLVRTYPHQDFDTDDLWQDWPVYDEGEYHSSCDEIEG